MRTRLKDVAEKLNLSPGLISGVLNGRDNVWASEETRERIFQVARELNYQPSTAAQALSRGRTRTVALIYRRLNEEDYRLAYTGLAEAFSADLQRRGFDLMLANYGTQAEVLDRLRFLAAARACDSVILWGRETDTEEQATLLEELGMPFIVKGRHEERHPRWYQVDYDHEWMMANAVQHLVGLGHRRLAYVGFGLEDAFARALQRGFIDAHTTLLGERPQPDRISEEVDDVDANEKSFVRWLTLPAHERPTAFVMGAGNAAWVALERSLAHVGEVLGTGPDGFSAAGVASYAFRLMFGTAHAYQGIEIDRLAEYAAPQLLDAILSGEPCERIVRYRPSLSLAPTLDLLKHGVQFVNGSWSGNPEPSS